jgi:hypothetical protein
MGILTFLTSKRFLSPSVPAPAFATLALGAAAGASVMFTSAMVMLCALRCGVAGSCLQVLDERDRV